MVSAWTIGTSKRQPLYKTTGGPGPNQYKYDKKQVRIPPKWKIGTENRQAFRSNDTPGPGSYKPRPQSANPAKYSMATKAGPKNELLAVPAPNAYNPRPSTAFKKAPQYSMASKNDQEYTYNNKYIGPGSYKQKEGLDKKATKIGTGQRAPLYGNNDAPGPGQYNINRPSTAQRTKIGTSQRSELYQTGTDNIGPNSYSIKGMFDGENSKGCTIAGRRKYGDQTEASLVPGPGSYNPVKEQRKIPPSYKMGTGKRSNLGHFNQDMPGPGQYDRQSTVGEGLSQNKIGTIGTDVRRPLHGNQENPGPGQYEYRSKVVEGPKFSIKGATKVDPVTREKIMNPGPGQYGYTDGYNSKPRPTSAKIGTSTRPDFLKARNTPGPGNYDYNKNKSGPAFGFGTSKRPALRKSDDPGPGNYNIPSSFADVPKYSKTGINTMR